MKIYIINLVMIGLYSIGYNTFKSHTRNKTVVKKVFVSLATIQLIVILSLRHFSIGVDVLGYVNNFKYIFPMYNLDGLLAHRQEIGYKLLARFIYLFTNNEQVFLSIIALLCIVPIGEFIYKYSKMPFLSFALYISFNYYSFVFSGLRQAIAYAIILSSYNFIIDKKIIKFILCVVFAALFHKSALIFLPAYFIADMKINKLTVSSILLFNLFVFGLRKQIFAILIKIFYENYEIVESLSIKWMILCNVIIICGLFFYKKVILVSQHNNALYIYLIFGASLMIFASVGTNVIRIADYYYMFVILFIPEVMHVINDKRLVLMVGYVLIILIFMLYILFIKENGFGIVPYKFFWQ